MARVYLPRLLPLEDYDQVLVLFSGGKDSLACTLDLLERGVPREKIQLWHHDIDGGHPTRKMDWPVTQNYVKALAEYLGITLRVSWRVNGFWGEVYRIGASWPAQKFPLPLRFRLRRKLRRTGNFFAFGPDSLRWIPARENMGPAANQRSVCGGERRKEWSGRSPRRQAGTEQSGISSDEVADSVICNLDLEALKAIGNHPRFPSRGSIANGRFCSPTRKREAGDSLLRNLDLLKQDGQHLKFPAKSGCHQGRWCSGALKAQVEGKLHSSIAGISQDVKLLLISGERRQESAGRSKYNEMEIHRANAAVRAHRLVHQWRSVIDWDEKQIWEIIKRWHIAPHPCYAAGWNRCSCAMCIFSLPRHWAGIRELFPDWVSAVEEDERVLGFTLDSGKPLAEYIGNAESCVCHDDTKALTQLTSGAFSVDDVEKEPWTLPAGAFRGAKGGPC